MLRHMCNNNLNKTAWLQLQLQQRCNYHSEKGVFGYRPKKERIYKGKLNSCWRLKNNSTTVKHIKCQEKV